MISRDDSLYKSAHGFDTQGKRDHIEQEHIAICVVAHQLVGLQCSAKSDYFVWIQIIQGLAMKQLSNSLLNHGHAGRTTHHHHAFDILNSDLSITQRFFNCAQGSLRERLGLRLKHFMAYI